MKKKKKFDATGSAVMKILLKVAISKFRRTQTLAIDKKQKTFLKSIIALQKLWRKRKIKSVDRKRSHNNSESDKY